MSYHVRRYILKYYASLAYVWAARIVRAVGVGLLLGFCLAQIVAGTIDSPKDAAIAFLIFFGGGGALVGLVAVFTWIYECAALIVDYHQSA